MSTRRAGLLRGASLSALLTTAALPAQAGGPKSLAQALQLATRTASSATGVQPGVTAGAQASLGAQNLATASSRFTSLAAALSAAATGSQANTVPIIIDGLASTTNPNGGLAPASGASVGSALWQGANLPSQTSSGGTVTVSVVQTAPVADLTWQSFNIGAKTTLAFNQSAGGTLASSWVVINTVQSAGANPTEILGQITAPGKVYVLDRNGIAFGAGSQINVGSLIAATADIAATQFSTTASGQTSFNLYGAEGQTTDPVSGLTVYYAPTFVNGNPAGSITVAEGASIETPTPTGTNGGGYVMLLGGNVSNAGIISTPQGQTIMAAGLDFTLRQGSTGSITTGNITSTTLGSEIASTNLATNGTYTTGFVTNDGIVLADQGDITLNGHAITQNGVLLSTTTVNTRGTIHLLTPNDGTDPTSSITLGAQSLTEILPEDDGETALDSQRATDVANSATLNTLRQSLGPATANNPQLNNTSLLPDQLAESRVEISTGGAATFQSGALVDAPGGQIAVGGGNQVLIQSGATLDVSGSTDALLPASVNDILVNVQPFQLRDSAANRTGALKGTNVYVDARDLVEIASGDYAGNIYTPGGLLEVSGYLGLIPHTIEEWTAIGGQVTLQARQTTLNATNGNPQTTPGAVIAQAGSVINLQGGTVTYEAGNLPQTYVVATTGQVFDINDAPGNLVYTGIYMGQVVDHSRWGITDTYVNPLLTPATIYDPSYTVGRDAGTLTVNGGTIALDGLMPAGVTLGQYQNGPRPSGITDSYLLAQTVVPQGGALFIGNYISGALANTANATNVSFEPANPTTTIAANSANINATNFDADNFASLTLSTAGNVTVAAPLTVASGGTIFLTGANLNIEASLTAHAGAITLTDQLYGTPVAATTSVSVASGAVLDTSGLWTNGVLDPTHLAGLGFANGGSITIAASQGVTLSTGSTLTVASGGGILPGGKAQTASGGAISITADAILPFPTVNTAPVVLNETLLGYGSKGGGTLSITVPNVTIVGPNAGPAATGKLQLGQAFFTTGFSKYVVDGLDGLSVLPGAQITAEEPIYVLGNGLSVPTGDSPTDAYYISLPPLYTPNKGTDSFSQRAGASITLLSANDPSHQGGGGGGTLSVAAGSSISVDPGQTISLAAFNQVTIAGTLTAHSGTIDIANTRFDPEAPAITQEPSEYQAGVSIWIADGSLLDVSGQAVTATDGDGRVFGLAPSGGTIAIGGYVPAGTSTWAQVIIRPGAVLDANGASAEVTIVPGAEGGPTPNPVELAGTGGTIALRSLAGIALDGTATAAAGAPDAAGGTLSLSIDPTQLGAYSNIPTYVYQPREILVSNQATPGQPANAAIGDIAPADTFGIATISQAQIDQGGFTSVTLAAQGGAIVFNGNVSLHTASTLTLSSGVIGDSSTSGTVSLSAPVVHFSGYTEAIDSQTGDLAPHALLTAATGTLNVSADLLTFSDMIDLGGISPVTIGGGTGSGIGAPANAVNSTAYGFAANNFSSSGDIQFLGSTGPVLNTGVLQTLGNITFTAAQLYPTSLKSTEVIAGYNPGLAQSSTASLSDGGTITVQGTGTTPQAPYSVGGSLDLVASTINQGGIIRAPEGQIILSDGDGSDGNLFASQINLLPGSITSVSLYGQTIPYGGTVDGVTYLAPGGGTPQIFEPQITLQSQAVDVQTGATIDLRGGGTLSGAAFIYGRGGSADVLTTPLLNTNGGAALATAAAQVTAVAPINTNDPVYAILPGYASDYAPAATAGDSAYTATKAGEQITIGNEIPGLAAGTYTLLPAYYALLPGAYRIELTSGTLPNEASIALGNFSQLAPVTLSFANTGVSSPVPTAAIVTSSANVLQLAQYDQESYNSFEAASATQFGAARPVLPQDAKTLDIIYPGTPGTLTALSISAASLLKTPDTGGYGATLELDTEIAQPGAFAIGGATDMNPQGDIFMSADTLSALDMSRLVIGGTISPSSSSPTVYKVAGDAYAVEILPDAKLSAGDIMLAANAGGAILVDGGATLSTIGAGPAAFDITSGYSFTSEYGQGAAYPVLSLSNGNAVFVPNTDASQAAEIIVGDGAALLAGGSLNIVAPASTIVTVGDAELGAKYATIAVAAINIGNASSLAALASQLPSGINFTPQSLNSLLEGSATLGTPAATQLTLTASQEVNIVGTVALNSGTTDLVLNTPAIYGVGTASDTASITAPSFTWNGVGTQNTLQVGQFFINASALPGGQIAAGLAQSAGTLAISAGTITLGYGPQTQANDQVTLNRIIAGFSNVDFTASDEITANNQSALSVYAQQPNYGQPGTGGNLTLSAPLITTDSGAVLSLTAGGALNLVSPSGTTPAATGSIATLGGQINLTAQSVVIDTSVALPSGALDITDNAAISLGSAANIDLSGRAIHLLDQTVFSPGGSLSAISTAGGIDLSSGATLNVSGPSAGAAAGAIALTALQGDVNLDATLLGEAATGQTSGSFSVAAGTLSTSNTLGAGSVFGQINADLNSGGFTASRSFETGLLENGAGASTSNISIANNAAGAALLNASQVSVTADLGSIDVVGTINASGTGPGTITLAAARNITLETTALLDAHATTAAKDSNGQLIDAENTALITLTTTAGSLLLNGGTLNLTYAGMGDGALGKVVLNAPRVGPNDVAITASAPITIQGAQSIALYAWRSYSPTDPNGTILQSAPLTAPASGADVTLDQINADNTAFMTQLEANGALSTRLVGLITYGADFHLRPGVEIDSSAASGGNLTIAGDLDFSGLRYSDVGYGLSVNSAVVGSGEPGSVVFRATNDLTVNGSVTDGFAPPPGGPGTTYLKSADTGWVIISPASAPAPDPLNADILLPSSVTYTSKKGVVTSQIELEAGTTFDETRDVSLNYAITILSAQVNASTILPFSATLAADVSIPQGGFVTTAAITTPTGIIPAGTTLASGATIPAGSVLGAGTVLPVAFNVADNTVVPAGTPLSTFADSSATLTLSANTAPLPVNAFLPSNTVPLFITPSGTAIGNLELRPDTAATATTSQPVQGELYALSAMLPAGSQSWNLAFTAGADQASADRSAVLPAATLNGGALAPAAQTDYQAAGSLILDDQHYVVDSTNTAAISPAFSVIRTGTGDLSLVAGGNIDQSSLFGIYTAGTQDPLPGGAAANAPYNTAREGATGNSKAVVGGSPQSVYNQIISSTYQAYYPTGGGNVLVSAGGNLTGDLYGGTTSVSSNLGLLPSDAVGNWLWRQGSTQLNQPTAWWINFGTFVIPYAAGDQGTQATTVPQLVGFQGIGALGGGNVTVTAAGNAGQTTDRSGFNLTEGQDRGEGLVIAVASTGREISSNGTTSLVETGGGNLTLHIGGTLNPIDAVAYGLTGGGSTVNGAVIDLRGTITVTAGAIGREDTIFSAGQQAGNPTPPDPYSPDYSPSDGITIIPGDTIVDITTQRDLVLDGVGDAGRITEQNLTNITAAQAGNFATIGGATGFTLWTADTSISLFSSGGNASPITAPVQEAASTIVNDGATDGRVVYPSQLYVTAATGDIVYGSLANPNTISLETMPSANEQVAFLAGNTIQANFMAIDLSGANPADLSTPLNPAFSSDLTVPAGSALTNIRVGGGTAQSDLALFALEPDTPSTTYLSAAAQATPALFYAASGNILDFITGETLSFPSGTGETLAQWYLAAKPVYIEAGQDIISSGTRPGGPAGSLQQNQQSEAAPSGGTQITASGNLFLNNNANSLSLVSAGQDIFSGFFYVGGPGQLVVTAGRNIDQIGYSFGGIQLLDYGSIKSLGSLLTGAPVSLTGGAAISVLAGVGTGADYTDFANLYLNPANQADLSLPITDPANQGKVQLVYTSQLVTWLQQNYGYTGTAAGALAFFLNPANVPVANQQAFLRTIFFAELLASGEQYTDPTSRFVGSYVRGRQAIDALLPGTNGQTSSLGEPAGYTGQITMASGTVAGQGSTIFDAGVATEHGGAISVVDPGGAVVLGTSGGASPGSGTGLITNGSGDIDVFATGSVLLGKSRIFTNAGGNIQIWSATGDINAGIGARTSVVYTPPIISYDLTGGLVESPAVPSSGAGIATEQPLPSVPAGNIDLTAPIGTIDAGEAGVRSSGNLNLAAARFANAAGFSAGGKTSGNSAAPTVSLGSVEAAGAAAGAGSAAAQNAGANRNGDQQPSIIEVEFLGVTPAPDDDERKRKKR